MHWKDIDAVHQRPEGTASRNFRTNRKYFIIIKPSDNSLSENEIQMDEIRPSESLESSLETNNRETIFIIEFDYYMLVKSFTDDLSGQV